MTASAIPKLRPIDIRPIEQGGRPSLLLRDPLQLGAKSIVIPRELAPALALCDGTRDVQGLHASLLVRFGLRVDTEVLNRLVRALDQTFLLDNERASAAQQRALSEYRQAPYRSPTSAGLSYPAEPEELGRLLESYVEQGYGARSEPAGEVRGLISPHIDYARGGRVYAATWAQAVEAVRAADLVVLLGTDHYGDDGSLTLTRQRYATPFGVLPTAEDAVDALATAIGEEAAFAQELYHRSEHSIELASVWLHYIRRGQPCELVPVLCGSFGHFLRNEIRLDKYQAFQSMLESLPRIVAGRNALIVAAGDLSHVGPMFGGQPLDTLERARVQAADQELMRYVNTGDPAGFFEAIRRVEDRYNVCGLPPIYLALRLLSPVRGQVIAYDCCPADDMGTSLVSICGILLT